MTGKVNRRSLRAAEPILRLRTVGMDRARVFCAAQDGTSRGIEHDEQDTVTLELL